jgi:hypothetical protein
MIAINETLKLIDGIINMNKKRYSTENTNNRTS